MYYIPPQPKAPSTRSAYADEYAGFLHWNISQISV
jgi:hypothetical protein